MFAKVSFDYVGFVKEVRKKVHITSSAMQGLANRLTVTASEITKMGGTSTLPFEDAASSVGRSNRGVNYRMAIIEKRQFSPVDQCMAVSTTLLQLDERTYAPF